MVDIEVPESYFKLRKRMSKSLSILKEIISKFDHKPILLDVGCRQGLICELKSESILYGLDKCTYWLSQLKERGYSKTICINLDNENINLQNESIEILYAGDVIEHLLQTQHAIEEFYRVLKPKGYLFLTTPNLGYLENLWRLFRGKQPPCLYHDHDKEEYGHISYYTYRKLTKILSEVGFHDIIYHKFYPRGTFRWFYKLSSSLQRYNSPFLFVTAKK